MGLPAEMARTSWPANAYIGSSFLEMDVAVLAVRPSGDRRAATSVHTEPPADRRHCDL